MCLHICTCALTEYIPRVSLLCNAHSFIILCSVFNDLYIFNLMSVLTHVYLLCMVKYMRSLD